MKTKRKPSLAIQRAHTMPLALSLIANLLNGVLHGGVWRETRPLETLSGKSPSNFMRKRTIPSNTCALAFRDLSGIFRAISNNFKRFPAISSKFRQISGQSQAKLGRITPLMVFCCGGPLVPLRRQGPGRMLPVLHACRRRDRNWLMMWTLCHLWWLKFKAQSKHLDLRNLWKRGKETTTWNWNGLILHEKAWFCIKWQYFAWWQKNSKRPKHIAPIARERWGSQRITSHNSGCIVRPLDLHGRMAFNNSCLILATFAKPILETYSVYVFFWVGDIIGLVASS